MIIHARFLREFDLWFNGDLIHINDHERMMEDAESVAMTVSDWPDAKEILTQIDYVLDTRKSEEILQFINTTLYDWYFDEKETQLLFEILTTLRNQLVTSLQDKA